MFAYPCAVFVEQGGAGFGFSQPAGCLVPQTPAFFMPYDKNMARLSKTYHRASVERDTRKEREGDKESFV